MRTEKIIETLKTRIKNKDCQILVIFRGVSGCGKSTFGAMLVAFAEVAGLSAVQLEADDFYTDEKGSYLFTLEQRPVAHADCFARFCKAVEAKVNVIALTNVSSEVSEFSEYQKLAEDKGYTVISTIVENRRSGQDVHNITDEAKEQMLKNFKKEGNIKLL